MISKFILHTQQRQFMNQEHTNQYIEWGSVYIVTKQFTQWEGSDRLFFTVIDYNIRIFLNDRELVSDYLISVLGSSLNFSFFSIEV